MSSIPQELTSNIPAAEPAAPPSPTGGGFGDIVDEVKKFLGTDIGRIVLVVILAMGFAFLGIIKHLPEAWFNKESYFQHGVLVPFLCLYIVYDRREQIAKTPVKPVWWMLIPLALVLWTAYTASRGEMEGPLSYCLVTAAFIATTAAAGWRMTWTLSPALFYLIFAFPFGQGFLDRITVRFQGFSTDMSYELLKLFQVGPPMRINSTEIIVGNYSLYVAAACSGLKITLSVFAFVFLFMFIGRLKWWANLILFASVIPLCVLVNGIRIAMIGVVGCYNGDKAAETFHDWSGYISIGICFFLLMKLTRMLGWK